MTFPIKICIASGRKFIMHMINNKLRKRLRKGELVVGSLAKPDQFMCQCLDYKHPFKIQVRGLYRRQLAIEHILYKITIPYKL